MQRAGERPVVTMNTVAVITVSYNAWVKNMYFRTMADAMSYINADKFISALAHDFGYAEGTLVSLKGSFHNGNYDAIYKVHFIDRIWHDYEFCKEDEFVLLATPIIYSVDNILNVHVEEVPVIGLYDDKIYVVTANGRGGGICCQTYFSKYEDAKEYVRNGVIDTLDTISSVYHTVGKPAVSFGAGYYSSEVCIRQGDDKSTDEIVEVKIKQFYIH